jgi:CheY-like chemotaxis protein
MSTLNRPLLIAEDSDEDFFTVERLFKQMAVDNPIHRCQDGDEVLDFFNSEQLPPIQTNPAVILLDLNLPGTDGRAVLEALKRDRSLKKIPVVIFTSSDNPNDVEFCYQHGANGYLLKPMGRKKLEQTLQAFVDYWLRCNQPVESL